jgi:hypothetical protein
VARIEIEIIMNPLPTSNEHLKVDPNWDVGAGTKSVCESDLDKLASAALSMMMIKSNVMEYFPYPIKAASDLPLIYTQETVAPLSYWQSPSDVHSVKTVSDASPTDQSYCSTRETALKSLDQALHKGKRSRPGKRTMKPSTVTTRRLGWKKPKDAPKRYLSAYNYFFSNERKRMHAESDERAEFERLGKIIGQRWRSLTDDQRRPYEIMAEKDIDRYREEFKIYDIARRRKYGRSLYRSPAAVTTASTLSDDLQYPSPVCLSPALHPDLESVKRQHQFVHYPPPPLVYAPQVIMSVQHDSGQYLNAGRQCVGQTQLQQYAHQQQNPQVQYACVRMSRKKAQEYMRWYEGGQH